MTFNRAQPWEPFLATISQGWGSIIDQDWASAQGAWDGDCETWPEYYSLVTETTPLGSVPLGRVMNGSGPYMLESLTPVSSTRRVHLLRTNWSQWAFANQKN